MLVLVGGEEPAVDAVGAAGIGEHEVAHPVTLTARCGALEGLVPEIVRHHLNGTLVVEDLGSAGGLDGPARMNGDGGRFPVLDARGERFGECTLIVLAEQSAEVARESAAPGPTRLPPCASRLCG